MMMLENVSTQTPSMHILPDLTRFSNPEEGESSDALMAVLGAVPVPLVWFRLGDGQVLFVNHAFRQQFGYEPGEVRNSRQWTAQFPIAAQREEAMRRWQAQRFGGAGHPDEGALAIEQMELQMLASDGSERTVLHSGVVLPAFDCALAVYVDITMRKQDEVRLIEAERAAREREVLYPILLNHTHEMIVLASADGVRRYVSPAVLLMTGWAQEEYLARRLEDTVHPDDREMARAARDRCIRGAAGEQVRYRSLKKDGSYQWLDALVSSYRDPLTQNAFGYVVTVRDASQQQAEQEARTATLERQAHFDHLTGVANRHVFYSALHEEARRQIRRTHPLALLLIDVDHFKLFNDSYGHLEGDRVLRRIADILKMSANRVDDLAARFGGEEFMLLLPATEQEGAVRIAEKLLATVQEEAIPHAGSAFGYVTVSIGIACWPAGRALDCDQLLLDADKSLYCAKRLGRNRVYLEHCKAERALEATTGTRRTEASDPGIAAQGVTSGIDVATLL